MGALIRDDFVIEAEVEVYFVEKKSVATPSAVTFFFVGQRITPLVSPWSTTTKRELKLVEGGRLVIRSQETCWKGQEAEERIEVSGGAVG